MATPAVAQPTPRILERPEHRLSRQFLSSNAMKVLYRLHRSGYQAYLVGGSVRDILLGREPKDFDVATNARPQEIRRLFRNSRIIGRRFRLAHIFFRGEIVEVATFRASPDPPEGPDDWEEAAEEAVEDEDSESRLGPDTEVVYGTPAEDAQRRDFTVNALFYNIADFTIIDHVGGIDDLERRVIRTIGEPEVRFEEDPVRMMRALEYAVRLGFTIDGSTAEAISNCHRQITDASSARLTYELLESLRSGEAAGIWAAWREAGLFPVAFPYLEDQPAAIARILEVVDRGTAAGRTYRDASLIGGFFVARFFELVERIGNRNGRPANAEVLAQLRELLAAAGADMRLANQTQHLMHQGLFALTKMISAPTRGRQVLKLTRQDYFQVTWDLFEFATELGLVSEEAKTGWKKAVGKVRRGEQPIEDKPQNRSGRRRRRRRRRQ